MNTETQLLSLASITSLDLTQLREVIWDEGHDLNRGLQLKKLSSILLYLNYNLEIQVLPPKEAGICMEMASTLISILGIRSRHHPHAFLLFEFQKLVTKDLYRNKNYFSSYWSSIRCQSLQVGEDDLHWLFFQGSLSLRNFQVQETLSILGMAKEHLSSKQDHIDYITLKAKCHRYLDQKLQYEGILKSEYLSPWERAVASIIVDGECRPLNRLTVKGGGCYDMESILENYLWLYASKLRASLNPIVNVENLKRRKGVGESTNASLIDIVKTLQKCYDADRPLNHRIDALGEKLGLIKTVASVDQELLSWVAAGRWLSRSKAKSLAVFCFNEYRQTCLGLSLGASHDLLNQLGDLDFEKLSNRD